MSNIRCANHSARHWVSSVLKHLGWMQEASSEGWMEASAHRTTGRQLPSDTPTCGAVCRISADGRTRSPLQRTEPMSCAVCHSNTRARHTHVHAQHACITHAHACAHEQSNMQQGEQNERTNEVCMWTPGRRPLAIAVGSGTVPSHLEVPPTALHEP